MEHTTAREHREDMEHMYIDQEGNIYHPWEHLEAIVNIEQPLEHRTSLELGTSKQL